MSHDQSGMVSREGADASLASIVIALISCLGLLVGVCYCWEDSLHGEVPPQTASMLFVPLVWIAVRQPLVQHRFHRFALASTLCCFGLGWFVYLTRIRMGYMDWIMQHAVAKNPHSHGLLLWYFGGSVLICCLAAWCPARSTNTPKLC